MQREIVDNVVYLDNGTHRWVMKVASPQGQQPHWMSSIMTNTDGEVKVKFYYEDGAVCIY